MERGLGAEKARLAPPPAKRLSAQPERGVPLPGPHARGVKESWLKGGGDDGQLPESCRRINGGGTPGERMPTGTGGVRAVGAGDDIGISRKRPGAPGILGTAYPWT